MQKFKNIDGAKIVLGVCSSIAVYKACELVSRLGKCGAQVEVAMTENAARLVSPRLFQTLSRNPVAVDMWGEVEDWKPEHISLAQWGDALLVAPASANMIGKFANGIADDFLSTTYLAFNPKRVLIAPAMNCDMWAHAAVRRNVERLKSDGAAFVEPAEGRLACGVSGRGRLADSDEILAAVDALLEG